MLELGFERLPIGLSLSRDLAGHGRQEAAIFRLISMRSREVSTKHVFGFFARRVGAGRGEEPIPHAARSASNGLGEELFFRFEVVVEAADREPSPLHHIHDRARFDTTLSKQSCRRSQDRLTGLLLLISLLGHGANATILARRWSRCLVRHQCTS